MSVLVCLSRSTSADPDLLHVGHPVLQNPLDRGRERGGAVARDCGTGAAHLAPVTLCKNIPGDGEPPLRGSDLERGVRWACQEPTRPLLVHLHHLSVGPPRSGAVHIRLMDVFVPRPVIPANRWQKSASDLHKRHFCPVFHTLSQGAPTTLTGRSLGPESG